MKQWNDFKERMDHEFSRPESTVSVSILSKGYKLDGNNGIKNKIGFDKLKSVDYIAENKSWDLVEFSDLYSQQNDISIQAKSLCKSDLSKIITRKINKKHWGLIQKELVDKYKDTLWIVNEMQKNTFCSELATQYQNNSTCKKYWIVVAPFHADIKDENKEDLARFLEKLKDDIMTSFPKSWNICVYITSIDNFTAPKLK